MRAMKRINIILLACSVFFFTSCEKEDRTYNGPPYVEFAPNAQFKQEAGIDGMMRKTGDALGLETFVVQKIAYLTAEEQTVSFRVADVVYYMNSLGCYLADLPEGTSPGDYTAEYTTMVEGFDYSFDGIEGVTFDKSYLKGSVTIKPNESFAYIYANIFVASTRVMYIVLDDSNDFIANKYTRILKYTPMQP